MISDPIRLSSGTLLLVAAALWIAGPARGGPPSVDAGLTRYRAIDGIAGTLSAVGSDTLNNLMTLWSESFRERYPSVRVQVEGKGSSTAPPALISGAAQLGPMSREMKESEKESFERRFGYPPTPVRVAIDALAVYVHPGNPIAELSPSEVDAVFSKTRLCGAPRGITVWSELGIGEKLGGRPIRLYGRNSASGTYGFFKEHALCGGDFRDTVKEQPGSASVVQAIATDPAGIGYSGIGYQTSGVRAVRLSDGQQSFGTDPEDVLSGSYPLSRFLLVYVNRPPGRPLDPLVREFIDFVLSYEGQRIVVKDGYLPLSAGLASEERAKLE